MPKKIWFAVGWSAMLLLTSSRSTSGQIRSGAIVGRVVDPTAAPVVAAEVIVIAQDTNARFETRTNAAGQYAVPYLPAGRYSLAVTVQGFVPAKLADITVGTAQTVRADVTLSLGTVSTVVEVRGNSAELQTESATVQSSVTDKLIATVPNISHNPLYYATLQAGVVPRALLNDTMSINSFGIGQDARRNFSAFSVNGGQAFMNDIVLDGVSVQSATYNEATVIPNPDGIQEVRTMVNNYSAEFGRAQGVITVTSKSGSNRYHGSGSYQLRNEALNANTFGNNARGIPRAPFKAHTYGGTLGGPIKKDKTFFFLSYEGLGHNEAVDYFKTVPTALERRGDFSRTLVNVSGRAAPLKLFDPFDVRQVEPNVYRRMPIPNAIIPRPDPFVLKMFSFYPMPNREPEDPYNKNNYFLRGQRTYARNSVNSRLDYRWSNHSFYGTGGVFEGTIETTPSWGPGLRPFDSGAGFIGSFIHDRNPYAALGDTVILSPTLILDFRYGVARVRGINELERSGNFDYDQFGIPKEIQAINPVPGGPPRSNWGGNWSPLQSSGPWKRQQETNHDMVSSITKTVNRWTLKFGGEYRVYLSNFYAGKNGIDYESSAGFTRELINAAGSGVGVVTPDVAGYGPASLLLGAGTLTIQPGSGKVTSTFAHKYLALYSQNDWRATNRLTVNLGVRWDLQPAPTDRYNNFCAFDASARNPFGGPGAFACAGAGGNSRNLWDTHYRDFAPRLGLAYRATDTFVIRMGYGLTYLPSNTGYKNTPFVWGMDTFQPATTSDPFGPNPAGVLVGRFNEVNRIIPTTGSDLNPPQIYGSLRIQRFPRRDFQNQNVQQWNLFLEKRVGSAWLLAAGYSASKGSHLLFARVPVNDIQLLPQPLLDSWRQGYIERNGRSDPGAEQIPNPFQPAASLLIPFNGNLGRATLSRAEALFPSPHFAGLELQRTMGWSSYHSLVLQANRRFSNGLLLNAHYTWSKALDFTQTEANSNDYFDTGKLQKDGGSGFDLRNLRNNYSLAFTDTPHRFVISYVYELPFGTGKRLGVGNQVLKRVVSGWRTGGVATFHGGFPNQMAGAQNGALNGRPDRLSGVPIEVPQELQRWYDGKTTVTLPGGRKITPCNLCFLKYSSEAFRGRVITTPNGSVVNDVYWFGNAAWTYGDFRGPGMNNWNLSIERSFRRGENLSVDLSAQFTNAFNHTRFRPAINGVLGSTNITANSQMNIQPGQGLSSDFGTHGTDTFDPRQVELHLKFRF